MFCNNCRNKSVKNVWKDGRTRTGWFNMTLHQCTLLCLCSIITGRFCIIWGNKPPKTYKTMVEPGLADLLWQYACEHFFVSAAILAPKNMSVVSHPPYLPDYVSSKCFLVSENQIAATSIPFPVCPWHSGKIAYVSTCHSKKSVAVVLPAVAKMLDAMNKLEMGIVWHGQPWQVTKLRLYSVTDLVKELLDISSYSVKFTDHVPSFYGTLQTPVTSF